MKGLGVFTLAVSAVASTLIIVETCYDLEQKISGKFYDKLAKGIVGTAEANKAKEEPKAEEAKESKTSKKEKTE